jgi:hypothetical protein
MNADLAIMGAIGIVLGASLAMIADRFPARRSTLQYWGGGLVIGGVTLVAFATPFV